MDARALLEHLRAEGLTLRAVAGALEVQPASKLTIESRRLIRTHKPALLELVRWAAIPPAGIAEVPTLAARLHGAGTPEAHKVVERFRHMAPARVPEELAELRLAVGEGDR